MVLKLSGLSRPLENLRRTMGFIPEKEKHKEKKIQCRLDWMRNSCIKWHCFPLMGEAPYLPKCIRSLLRDDFLPDPELRTTHDFTSAFQLGSEGGIVSPISQEGKDLAKSHCYKVLKLVFRPDVKACALDGTGSLCEQWVGVFGGRWSFSLCGHVAGSPELASDQPPTWASYSPQYLQCQS